MKNKTIFLMGLLSLSGAMFAAQEAPELKPEDKEELTAQIREGLRTKGILADVPRKAGTPISNFERNMRYAFASRAIRALAYKQKSREEIEEYLKRQFMLDPELINYETKEQEDLEQNEDGSQQQPTLLMNAAYEGDLSMINFLLAKGASALHKTQHHGRSWHAANGRADLELRNVAALEKHDALIKTRSRTSVQNEILQEMVGVLQKHDFKTNAIRKKLIEAAKQEQKAIREDLAKKAKNDPNNVD